MLNKVLYMCKCIISQSGPPNETGGYWYNLITLMNPGRYLIHYCLFNMDVYEINIF